MHILSDNINVPCVIQLRSFITFRSTLYYTHMQTSEVFITWFCLLLITLNNPTDTNDNT